MTCVLFDEHAADEAVIESLLQEVRSLTPMPIFKLADGRFFEANEEDLNFLTETDLIRKLEHAKRKVNEFEALLQAGQEDHTPSQPEAPVTPVENPPTQPEQPVVAQFMVNPIAPAAPIVQPLPQPEQVSDVPNDPIRIQ